MIVGAGPAGSTAAYELASKGMSVVLLDRAVFPRPKLCAGGVTMKTARSLPFDISPAVERSIYGIEFTLNFGRRVSRRSDTPFMYTVTREKFDHLLMEKARCAGATVCEGIRVSGVDLSGSTPVVVTPSRNFHAHVVIGADGAGSRVARSAGLSLSSMPGVAVQCDHLYTDGGDHNDDIVKVDWGTIPTGYAWAFPKSNGWSIGTGAIKPLTSLLGRYLWKYGNSDECFPRASNKPRGHLLTQRNPHDRIHNGPVLLVGDAAGLVDTLTGEGIYYAIRSGQLAAEAIFDSLCAGNIDLGTYERKVDSELMPELNESRSIGFSPDP